MPTISFSDIREALLSLFWPNSCPLCGRLLECEGEVMCRECMERLPRTEQFWKRDNLTEECFTKVARFQRGAAFLFYHKEEDMKRLIREMKYHDRPQLAEALALEAAYDMMHSDFLEDIDLLMPVPLHPQRLRERGYNQSEVIARAIGRVAGIEVDTTHVVRVKNNPQQARMKKALRESNVAGIFEVRNPEELKGKHILLVDDLVTTGATLRAMMEAMKPCRGAKYSVFSLCKTRL